MAALAGHTFLPFYNFFLTFLLLLEDIIDVVERKRDSTFWPGANTQSQASTICGANAKDIDDDNANKGWFD